MKSSIITRIRQYKQVLVLNILAATASVFVGSPALAIEFNSGELKGSVDTTLSYGATWRLNDQNERLIGVANGGRAFSVNGDDGNLNYDEGIVSNTVKATIDAEISYRNFGGFIRGTAFRDFENEDEERERSELSDDALDRVGSRAEILDAYIWNTFHIGSRPAEIRAGEQVLSWGESTFIQNSINTINPVDVSNLRVPGAELREALVPVGLVTASMSSSSNTNVELFYQYRWEETVIDPAGSYFSTNDFAVEGGNKVILGFGSNPDNPELAPQDTRSAVPRANTDEPENGGQYGVALRWFLPKLNDTEFGFYFINYHSRLPIVSARTGTLAGALATGSSGDPNDYTRTARYRTEYPEDIKLYGISFNTEFTRTGIALQGEVSYRRDLPLQVDDAEIVFAALGPIIQPMAIFNQVGDFRGQFETDIPGFIERNVTQVQMTATKIFGPMLGANQFALIGEAALTHVHDMPSKSELRLEAPGAYLSGNDELKAFHGVGAGLVEDEDNFADATSWGYQIRGRLTYNNAIGAVSLSPRLAWRHDVKGNTPGPGGNFLEGRNAVTLGVEATYQNSYSADISYTRFSGAGRHNLLNDRDFIAANIKYSF